MKLNQAKKQRKFDWKQLKEKKNDKQKSRIWPISLLPFRRFIISELANSEQRAAIEKNPRSKY